MRLKRIPRLPRLARFARACVRWLAVGAALSLAYLALDLVCRGRVARRGWYTSWEYLTIKDRTVGFVLRTGVSMSWMDVGVNVNRSGTRDATVNATIAPKQPDELLVFAVGDSNTFGIQVPYDRTFPVLLQRLLSAKTARKVRVVNLGVPGFSSLQARLLLERWMPMHPDLVIFSDCFNDRGYAREDGAEAFEREYRRTRIYEFGSTISYPLLDLGFRRFDRTPKLPLDPPLASSRVPPARFEDNLRQVIRLCRQEGVDLVFLATGDLPATGPPSSRGMAALQRSDWEAAEKAFREVTDQMPEWYLPRFRHHQACLAHPDADCTAFDASSPKALLDPRYLTQFLHFASEYIDVMRTVAAESDVPVLDMRDDFLEGHVPFTDVCHFLYPGHAIIAQRLSELLPPRFLPHPR